MRELPLSNSRKVSSFLYEAPMKWLKLLPLFLLLGLSGCGILIGQMMVAGGGVKRLDVVSGDLSSFHRGAKVAILAPFATTSRSYHIARGDDEARLGVELERRGVWVSLYAFLPTPGDAEKTGAQLRTASGVEVMAKLNLKDEPQYLLTGTVLTRDNVVAPMRGVMMEASYRLELTNLSTHKTLVLETEVKDLFPDAIPAIADAIDKLVAQGAKGR